MSKRGERRKQKMKRFRRREKTLNKIIARLDGSAKPISFGTMENKKWAGYCPQCHSASTIAVDKTNRCTWCQHTW